MPAVRLVKYLPIVLVLPIMALLLAPRQSDEYSKEMPEKVNLALRRTADALLRATGDSTSRIPAVEQSGTDVWQIRLEQPFDYSQLPPALQSSFDLYGIRIPYEVKVRRCYDATIELGYHQLDLLTDNPVPCSGREFPEGCHYIEVKLIESHENIRAWGAGLLLLLLAAGTGFWYARRPKSGAGGIAPSALVSAEPEWLHFGQSRLDAANQVLVCGETQQHLTFRETKLLRLFATNPDRLLDRDEILRQVWADEGVLVGRSVDMFVSRLRKKLSADPSIAILAVHGVGYRLETGKAL